jgi:hypothetical protein
MPTPSETNAFIQAVRREANRFATNGGGVRYDTKPDERYDLTLIAYRVYGNRNEFMAILAAAGLDSVEQVIPEQTLYLPTLSQLHSIKRSTGYLTDAEKTLYASLN